MIQLEIRLFGAFKKYEIPEHRMELELDEPMNVARIKLLLSEHFSSRIPTFGEQGRNLVNDSALADEDEILNEESRIDRSCRLHLLPPVCGG
jgi:hypothetical protein